MSDEPFVSPPNMTTIVIANEDRDLIGFVGVWRNETTQTRRRRVWNWLRRRGSTARTITLTASDVRRLEDDLAIKYGLPCAGWKLRTFTDR